MTAKLPKWPGGEQGVATIVVGLHATLVNFMKLLWSYGRSESGLPQYLAATEQSFTIDREIDQLLFISKHRKRNDIIAEVIRDDGQKVIDQLIPHMVSYLS